MLLRLFWLDAAAGILYAFHIITRGFACDKNHGGIMKKSLFKLTLLCSLATLFCFISSSTAFAADSPKLNSVALVSLSVSDVGGSVQSGSIGSTPASKLITAAVNDMLNDAEKTLASKWTVVKASTFIDNAGYRKPAVEKTLTVYVPQINEKEMAVFTQVSKEIKGGILDADKARDLCQALKVDGIVLIFSEWAAKTGGFVPTTKALTKNILTVWDASGNKVIYKRVDKVGNKTLGVGGFKAVNEETIGEWRDSFNRSLEEILKSL
jgi:hypothetical protein